MSNFTIKKGLAQMLKGRLIEDVIIPEQAGIAERDGVCEAIELERIQSDMVPSEQARIAERASVCEVELKRIQSDMIPSEQICRMADLTIKRGLAQMFKGGVIMDVVTPEQARIAENAGACAVMALERIPADMRQSGQVCRMSDPKMIKEIMNAVSIPVMAKCRIGHVVEAQVLEKLGVDYVDESEVLTPADRLYHIQKDRYKVPFVCGAKDLGEALRRIHEGASMLRTKGEAGTGDVSEAIKHIRMIKDQINKVLALENDEEVIKYAKRLKVPDRYLFQLIENKGALPVVNFAAGGVASPSDAALCMQLGCDGVFVGSGIFKSKNPEKLAKAIVNTVTHYNDPQKILEYSTDLGELMFGISLDSLKDNEKLSARV